VGAVKKSTDTRVLTTVTFLLIPSPFVIKQRVAWTDPMPRSHIARSPCVRSWLKYQEIGERCTRGSRGCGDEQEIESTA